MADLHLIAGTGSDLIRSVFPDSYAGTETESFVFPSIEARLTADEFTPPAHAIKIQAGLHNILQPSSTWLFLMPAHFSDHNDF